MGGVDTGEKQHDAPWARLMPAARGAITFLIAGPLALYGAGLGYFEYVTVTTGAQSFPVQSSVLFIGSLILIAGSSMMVSFYMMMTTRGSVKGVLGGLWLLSLLPIVASLFSDATALDYPFMLIVAFTAMRYWKGSAGRRWVLAAGTATLLWFVADPTVHITTLASDPAFFARHAGIAGPISPQVMTLILQSAYGEVFYDLLRLVFFAVVFYFSVRGGRTRV